MMDMHPSTKLSLNTDKKQTDWGDHVLSKDGILSVEMRLFCVRDEELGLVRVWTSVRHSHDPPVVELSKICIRTPGGTGSTCR